MTTCFFKFPPSREEVSLPRLADKQCEKKFFADESLQAARPEFQDVIFFAKVYYWSSKDAKPRKQNKTRKQIVAAALHCEF